MRLKERTAQLKQYCSEHDLTYMNERTSVLGYGHSEASKVTAAYRKALKEEEEKLRNTLDKSKKDAIMNLKPGMTTTTAGGCKVTVVKSSSIHGEPNSVTQTVNSKGGVNRNYYGENGDQTLQISNNDHGHKSESGFGKHGEHAHTYYYDENGKLTHGKARELTDEERKENDDIL